MRFACLGSGSRGNATVIAVNGTCILLDCGFSVRETERRLARLDLSADALAAIVVTHEHADHVNGVMALAKRYRLPVWMTGGTAQATRRSGSDGINTHLFNSHEPFAINGIEITPFPVPHDAREPCQFVFSDGHRRVGILTDTGSGTPHIEACLSGCDALVIECNHDPDLLRESNYPPSLKERIGGRLGHLANSAAASIVSRLDCSRLQHVVAAHLSEKNNTPGRARAALSGALGCAAQWVQVADQDAGLPWREFN